jgi:hypothetical protein
MSTYPTKNGVEDAEPLTFPEIRRIALSTQATYRGRTFTISFEGYTMDEAADLLDRKFSPTAAPNGKEHAAPLGTPPVCPVHHKPMKPMKFASKRGEQWMCTAKLGDDGWCEERA